MKHDKIGTWILLISGILTLVVGVYLFLNQIYSIGYTSLRSGEIHEGELTGFGGIFLGILLLILSLYNHCIYKKEKKKFDELED